MSGIIILLIILLIVVVAMIKSTIKMVKTSEVYVIERFGKYTGTLESGLHILVPFADRVARIIDIREQVVNFPPQPVITKDNVTMQIDTVNYIRVTDAEKYQYGVGNAIGALENLTATTLRNIIGDLELDETLTSRDLINNKIRIVLDEATDSWGIKVTRVEVKNIIPPLDIQQAMEKQMRAEREKREKILTAEGLKIAKITEAEGIKESTILRAQADKQEQILQAQGEAEAIMSVQTAEAEAIVKLNNSQPSAEILKLKGYQAFEKMADGKASKLIIPSNMNDIASLASIWETTKEAVKEEKTNNK